MPAAGAAGVAASAGAGAPAAVAAGAGAGAPGAAVAATEPQGVGLVVVTRDVVGLLLFGPSLRLAVVMVCWEKNLLYLIKTC